MIENREAQLKKAEKGAWISITAYLFISALKLVIGHISHSSALFADGLNNATDIVASLTVLIGLRISRKPADDEHRYGHWKVENLASLLTSLVMLVVGIQVFLNAIGLFFHTSPKTPSPLAAYVGLFSAVVMLGVYFYNKKLANLVKSPALKASAKDNLSDALTSIGTAIAVFASSFHLLFIDKLAALIIGVIIIKTGFDIFKESTFSLSDGFSLSELKVYKEEVESLPGIIGVKEIRGRSYGANVFLDVVIWLPPQMTVKNSHAITEHIEKLLAEKYGIFDVDIHVEPFIEKKEED